MTEILSILPVMLPAVLLIGPRRLPAGVEGLWLAWTSFSRSQHSVDLIVLSELGIILARFTRGLRNGAGTLWISY